MENSNGTDTRDANGRSRTMAAKADAPATVDTTPSVPSAPRSRVSNLDTIDYDKIIVNPPTVGERIYKYRYFYLMAIPVLIVLLIFYYWPMLGIRFGFATYKLKEIALQKGPQYTGFANFAKLLKSTPFLLAFRNTLVLSIVKLLLQTVVTVVVALLMNEIAHDWGKKFVQTVLYLPHFLSWVVAASIFMLILSAGTDSSGNNMGFVNSIIKVFNHKHTGVDFLTSTKHWRGVWYIMNLWKETGWGTIIYIAALAGISPDLYEAAEIDGANRFQQVWNITLPSLMNTILVVFILNLAKVMNVFESVFVLYNSLVYSVADVIQTYTYRVGIVNNDYGYATAIGLFKSIISLILVSISNRVSTKVRGYGIV